MPAKLAKRRPPVVRPFLHKYMGPKGYQKDAFLGGIPGLRSMFRTGCTLGFVLPSFAMFPLNDQRTICYFLEIFLVGCIFPVTKAKAWPQTPEELASLEIGESEATQYV